MVDVIDQFLELKALFNRRHHSKRRGHINITGGEPFLHGDIERILCCLGARRDSVGYGVLSNGSFPTDERIALLKETGCTHVQLSIDGSRSYHDSMRGAGDYDRVFRVAQQLEQNGITVHISFTANKDNMQFLPHTALECRRRGITRLWSDRLLPIGSGEQLQGLCIGDGDLPHYLRDLSRAKWIGGIFGGGLEVRMNRALQFLDCGDPYRCSAGSGLIVVDEQGNILPCRRMPIVCGNIRDETLREVYEHSDVFCQLREPRMPRECICCVHQMQCFGGAKCQAYAAYGDFNRADPACPLKEPFPG